MLMMLSLVLTQAAPDPVPVIHDAPPSMLLAGYTQCLARELDIHIPEQISPEDVFEKSQTECAFWLDAYIAKLASSIAITNIDYQQQKTKIREAARSAAIKRVTSTRSAADGVDPRK